MLKTGFPHAVSFGVPPLFASREFPKLYPTPIASVICCLFRSWKESVPAVFFVETFFVTLAILPISVTLAAFFVEVLSVTLTILPFSVVPSAFPVALDIVNDVTTIAALSKYAHILFCFRMFSPYLSVDY